MLWLKAAGLGAGVENEERERKTENVAGMKGDSEKHLTQQAAR